MSDLECSEVQEVSLAVDVDVDDKGPTEVWPGDEPFPDMTNDQEWDDFISKYDLSEVFKKAEHVTLISRLEWSRHGHQ